MEEVRRVADYFVVAGLPEENPQPLEQYNMEVNLKQSTHKDPITDITVIIPGMGERIPENFEMIRLTPYGHPADLNHGSIRKKEVYLCYKRSKDVAPLVEIGVMYQGKDKVMPECQRVEFTHEGNPANVNNTNNSATFLTFRRANEKSLCNEFVVTEICVILSSKGESPPHSFRKIDKTLNKGIIGSDVHICYKKSLLRPKLLAYKPVLLNRFPLKDRNHKEDTDFKLDDNLALFCLPMGATLEAWPSHHWLPLPAHSTFVLTPSNTEKIYGSALTFYEHVEESSLTEEQKMALSLNEIREKKKAYSNKCICILSHWPFFDAFEKFLLFLYEKQIAGPFSVPLERYISHFLTEVPFPSPKRPRIFYQMSGDKNIALYQPEELPLPRSGASFRKLLSHLEPDNCLLVLLLALTEQKILIHSFKADILTSVAEAIKQIIFPFYWQCPYIPQCPIGMSDYLAAPLPFIIGLNSRFFDLYDQPSDVSAIDLDTKNVTLGPEKSYLSHKLLPKKATKELRASLVQLYEKCLQQEDWARIQGPHDDGSIEFDYKLRRAEMQLEVEIRDAFLRFMVDILSGYSKFLRPIDNVQDIGVTDISNLFAQSLFIASRDKNYHEFYNLLLKTQMFTKFVEERSFVSDANASLAFFDECIARKNATHRFLELDNVEPDRSVFVLSPDLSDVSKEVTNEYRYEKFQNLNSELFGSYSSDDSETRSDPKKARTLAKRTKREIRSSHRIAKAVRNNLDEWPLYLVKTIYSLWFIHLPSQVLAIRDETLTEEPFSVLNAGLLILKRISNLRINQVDEVCYRTMMKLAGIYDFPELAVSILVEMRRSKIQPDAVTYGYYNKTVLESKKTIRPVSSVVRKWKSFIRQSIKIIREKKEREAAKKKQKEKADESETKVEEQDSNNLPPPKQSVSRTLFPNPSPPHMKQKQLENVTENLKQLPQESSELLPSPVPIRKSASPSKVSLLVGTPITSDDPLGAFLPPTPVKASVSTSDLQAESKFIDDNVLGEPFASDNLGRSSTHPRLNEDKEKSSSPFSKVFSKDMTSKLKMGSSYLLSNFSPNSKTKQEMFSTLKSAASTVMDKYNEVRMTPSKDSTDSSNSKPYDLSNRRPSEYLDKNIHSIWEKVIGTSAAPPATTKKIASHSALFKSFYSMVSKVPIFPIAVEIEITSCTKCRLCGVTLYDEEIMAGWTVEDSEFKTVCLYCSKGFVPCLTITVKDFRSTPPSLRGAVQKSFLKAPSPIISSPLPPRNEISELKSYYLEDFEKYCQNVEPKVWTLSVPYVSPIVLRKELENILLEEGDRILNSPSFVTSHGIVYWNLIWAFERVALQSNIKASILKSDQLCSTKLIHPSWKNASKQNVKIVCNMIDKSDEFSGIFQLYGFHKDLKSMAGPNVYNLLIPDHHVHLKFYDLLFEGVKSDDLTKPIQYVLEQRQIFKLANAPCLIYRELLFSTFVLFNRKRIDVASFDFKYRKNLSTLQNDYKDLILTNDSFLLKTAKIRELFMYLDF